MSANSQTKLNWRVTRRNNTSGAGTRLRKPDVEASRTAKPRTQKAPPSHKEIDNDSGEGHTPVSLWSTVGYQPEGAETDMAILKAFQFAKVATYGARRCLLRAGFLTTLAPHRPILSSLMTLKARGLGLSVA